MAEEGRASDRRSRRCGVSSTSGPWPDSLRANSRQVERLLKSRGKVISFEGFLDDGNRVSIENLDDLERVKAQL